MAQSGVHGGKPVVVDDVYEHNEVARDVQLEAFFQRIEEWFDAASVCRSRIYNTQILQLFH